MAALSLIGFAAFLVVSLWVGARLLWLARRTREVAELAIGIALFCGGAGYCGMIVAFRLHAVPVAAYPAAFALSMALLEVGVVGLLLGVWQLFRPGARWAATLFFAASAVLVASWVTGVAGFRPNGERTPFVFWSFNAVGGGAYAWSAVECFRYRALLERRARIGLVDRELVHRFLLWAIAGTAGAGVFAAGMLGRAVATSGHPGVQLVQSLAGFAAGVAIWLAFFPPQSYVRRVAGDAVPEAR